MCDNKSTNIKTAQDSFSHLLMGFPLLTSSVPPHHTGSFLHSVLLVRTYRACVTSEGQCIAYLTKKMVKVKKKENKRKS